MNTLKITTTDGRVYLAQSNPDTVDMLSACFSTKVFPSCKIQLDKYPLELFEYWTTSPEASAYLN